MEVEASIGFAATKKNDGALKRTSDTRAWQNRRIQTYRLDPGSPPYDNEGARRAFNLQLEALTPPTILRPVQDWQSDPAPRTLANPLESDGCRGRFSHRVVLGTGCACKAGSGHDSTASLILPLRAPGCRRYCLAMEL
jgi:hypothetical protein